MSRPLGRAARRVLSSLCCTACIEPTRREKGGGRKCCKAFPLHRSGDSLPCVLVDSHRVPKRANSQRRASAPCVARACTHKHKHRKAGTAARGHGESMTHTAYGDRWGIEVASSRHPSTVRLCLLPSLSPPPSPPSAVPHPAALRAVSCARVTPCFSRCFVAARGVGHPDFSQVAKLG